MSTAVAVGTLQAVAHLPASEIREALAHRRAAGEDFENAWAATLRGLPASQRDDLWLNAWQWRLAYERRGGTGVAKLLGVLEEQRRDREHTAVLG